MASYPEDPDVILSSAHNLNFRLESTNYLYWSFRVTTMLGAYNLRGYIDGTITAPADEHSPDFRRWRMYDSRVRCLLNTTLTDAALSHVLHTHTAREMWEALKVRFTSMSNFNIMKYRSDLQRITKGEDSVGVYVNKIKEIVSKLCGFEMRLPDAEIIEHALRGLPDEYAAFRNSIRAREEPLYTHHFFVMLLAEASILAGNNQH